MRTFTHEIPQLKLAQTHRQMSAIMDQLATANNAAEEADLLDCYDRLDTRRVRLKAEIDGLDVPAKALPELSSAIDVYRSRCLSINLDSVPLRELSAAQQQAFDKLRPEIEAVVASIPPKTATNERQA